MANSTENPSIIDVPEYTNENVGSDLSRTPKNAIDIFNNLPEHNKNVQTSRRTALKRFNALQELIYLAEIEDTRCTPLEFTQNEFLKLFELCTPEEFAELTRRRSQRRLRSVKSNMRSDYIYEMPKVNSLKENNLIYKSFRKRSV